MQGTQKKYWVIGLSFIIMLILAFIFGLKPHYLKQDTRVNSSDIQDQTQASHAETSTNTTSQTHMFSSQSQQDTQINCQIRVDQVNRLVVNEQTKDCFEYFITQYGEKNIQQIKTDFVTYIKSSFKEPISSQLTDLWSRYIQYREQLGLLEAPNIKPEDPKYYRTIFSNMQNLRQKFFSTYESEGLFGKEDSYNDYTLDRLAILDDQSLSTEEKAKQLAARFNQLPEDWKENLQQLSQLEDLRKLTSEIKARGGSATELRQMRTNLVGADATQRLEKLDIQRDDWKQRVNQYLTDRDQITQSSMSDTAKQTAVEQLKTQQFNNPSEQLRLHTFESVHDQGGKLPFSN
ncbi:lipase secretion chaperone [Acinetobacter sp. ANC 4648]|uniref:lipase secretion chaperone n=1 Tax=Acinetobacter sp. ANC 4648 TaxID=1977875 RepID=UPI000A3302CD|nr:lipase secretion chaperone [Acinetobacter sp. ANC 4648]OTG80756.1 lipase chaperone [Acinetobacter sp. ANC 4648]